ncbi:MAG: glutamine-hydrolyzing carbamoyl-phosphate synthase small subunit [Flavobacteriales bacterium]
MAYSSKVSAVLLLEDGTSFYGKAAGAIGTARGEICFNTGMTGYQEIFTDPSYFGQIMVMATAHIGNYGMHRDEVESDSIKIAGLVCKNFSSHSYRKGPVNSIQKSFEEEGLVGIQDLDTRALVRHIRDKGAMNAILSSDTLDIERLKEELNAVPSMEGLELSSSVGAQEAYHFGDPRSDHKVAVVDYGLKRNILSCLEERGAYIKVFPFSADHEEILGWEPDGIVLTNGPGDPAAMEKEIREVGSLMDAPLPLMGICLGHQLMALSQGLGTEKMHAGHRGINHPVIERSSHRDEVTSQNHGFVVKRSDAEKMKEVEISHVHLNDGTIAGLAYPDKNAFSVQYHPEASPGPHDPRYLFDRFIDRVRSGQGATETV